LDAEGYLSIVDRAKDVIKTGGEWVSSIDVENAAASFPAVDRRAHGSGEHICATC
jgi:acyl-CoA synthetase (AMP-forming)/AMP-acid ligase II